MQNRIKLIFEKSVPGHKAVSFPHKDVPSTDFPEKFVRKTPLHLPEVAEVDLMRHYTALSLQTFGVERGFYPLGSCTMKYNPKINEDMASLPGFAEISSADAI